MEKKTNSKRPYVKPIVKGYEQIEALVFAGKSSTSCRTDCR